MLQGDTQVPANQGAIKIQALTTTRHWAAKVLSRLAVYMARSQVAGLQRRVEAVPGAGADGKLELREHASWPWGQRQTDAGTANRSMG